MRWKLLIAFGGGFTVVFALVATWILRFSTDTATERVTDTLRSVAEGGATTIEPAAFLALVDDPPPVVVGQTYPDDAGTLAGELVVAGSEYTADPRYWRHVNELADIRRTNPDASPYTFIEAADGSLRFVGSWGARGYPEMDVSPPDGGKLLQDIRAIVDADTEAYFRRGLTGTTEQPAYTDTLDTWISVYTPIRDRDGSVIGALGVDYPLSYVDEVRQRVARVLYPVLGLAYVGLLVMVAVLSRWLTGRLGRLSAATQRLADGDYDVDLTGAASAVFPDEMTALADAFVVMADKVGARERSLARQVQVLKVEIDEAKRKEAVEEITDSDFFADLTAKAAAMRARVKGQVTGSEVTASEVTARESP